VDLLLVLYSLTGLPWKNYFKDPLFIVVLVLIFFGSVIPENNPED